MCPSVVVYVTVSVSVTNVQAYSCFEFTTAISGLMRKLASPCCPFPVRHFPVLQIPVLQIELSPRAFTDSPRTTVLKRGTPCRSTRLRACAHSLTPADNTLNSCLTEMLLFLVTDLTFRCLLISRNTFKTIHSTSYLKACIRDIPYPFT